MITERSFVPEHRGWVGEQLGVRRIYREPKLSTEHDVVTASHLALTTLATILQEAHELLGFGFDDAEAHAANAHEVERYWDYPETTENPDLVHEWGWIPGPPAPIDLAQLSFGSRTGVDA